MKIQEVIVKLLEPVTGIEETVDTLKTGDPTAEVKGIGVTFLATHNVIKKAVDAGINLLIKHGHSLKREPGFF
jgi:putative NIF3 family GTP cyclohydrolase 1 type 2